MLGGGAGGKEFGACGVQKEKGENFPNLRAAAKKSRIKKKLPYSPQDAFGRQEAFEKDGK